MKRTQLLRRSRLKARGPRSKKSGGHLFPKGVDIGYRVWLDSQWRRCLIAGRADTKWVGPMPGMHICSQHWTVKCHVKSRGSSGADKANIVMMCPGAHDEQHRLGIAAFERRWGVDLKAEAARLWAQYQQEQGAE